jgi:hypothetical protein
MIADHPPIMANSTPASVSISGSEPEIGNQEVEIDAEVAGGFDAAAWRGVAKPLARYCSRAGPQSILASGGRHK